MVKVAIIIPTLNEEKFIARCLDSVLQQSYSIKMMDIMVVDGGSKDRTCEIVNEYHSKYTNIRLLHNPGKIQSIAFNIGVKESTAPYVIRLDAHAVYNKVYVEKCLETFSAKAEVLGCASKLIGNVGGVWNISPQHSGLIAETSAILNQSIFGIGGAAFRVGATAGFVDTVPFGCFPRRVIETIGGMREDLPRGEDNEFNSRIKKAGYKIFLNPQIRCTYYSRDTFAKNIKQMYANGESIGHLFYIDKSALGLRHFVPLLFVTGILLGIILSLVLHPFFYVFLVAMSFYFTCDCVASFLAAKKFGWKFLLPLFCMFFCIHVSYGWGTIVGTITGRKLNR